MRHLLTAVLIMAVLAAPALAAEPVGYVALDLARLIVPLAELAALDGKNPATEVFEEFARRTGTRPDRDLSRLGLLVDDPMSEKVCFFLEGRFDVERLTAELLKEKAFGLSEAPLGALRGLKTGDTRFIVTPGRVLVAPLKSPYFADEAALRDVAGRIGAIDRAPLVTLRLRPPIQMMPALLAMLPRETPPPLSTLAENLESLALDVTEARITLEAGVTGPAVVDTARGQWQAFTETLRARFEKEEKEGREAMQSASTLRLLTPEVFGKLQGAASGRRLLDAVRLRFEGKTVRLEFDNPFKASFAALLPVVGVVSAIAIPNFQKAREQARQKACHANMRMLEGACEMKLMDCAKQPERITIEELVSEKYLKAPPLCPDGGAYTLDLGGESPLISCSKHGKVE